jgi:hypothetical protein
MKINIEIIPHEQQRYPTVGDWWVDPDGTLQIRASQLSESRYSALVALHELVEALIEGIKESDRLDVPPSLVAKADAWDKRYEERRPPDDKYSEPSAVPTCPVYEGHMAASAIEHVAAMLLGVDYNHYQTKIADLP